MGSLVRQKTKKGPVPGKVLKPHGDPWHALITKYCALANTKGQQTSCCLGSALPRGREAGVQQPEPESKGLLQSWPKDCIFHQTVGRLLVANHIFLGSWWFTSARSDTAWDQFPRGDTRQTWDCALWAHPGNQAAGTRDVHKMQGPPGTVHLPSTWSPEWLGPGKGTNTQTMSPGSVLLQRVQELEKLRPGKCTKCRARSGQCPCRAPWSLSSVDPGSTCHLGLWETQCCPSTGSSPHTPAAIVCGVPPSTQHNWTSEPKLVATIAHPRQDTNQTLKRLQTEESKINKKGERHQSYKHNRLKTCS